ELLSLRLANGRVERRHHTDKRRLSLEIGQLDRLQAALEVVNREIGGLLAHFHCLAGERERSSLECDSTGARHIKFLVKAGRENESLRAKVLQNRPVVLCC